MQLIKPATLSLISNTYGYRSGFRFAVGAVCLFHLRRDEADLNTLLPETEYLAKCHEALGKSVFELGVNKARPEFLAAGSAYAANGEAVERMRVSIELGDRIKAIDVYGDRESRPGLLGRKAGPLTPFTELPLVYERAYGGPGFAANPVGTGHLRSGNFALPNLVPAGAGRDKRGLAPAAFCATGVDWPCRTVLAGTYDRRWQERDAPGYPQDIDWRYFSMGAADQQFAGALAGGEPYRIQGMHPEYPLIEGRLPELRLRIFASDSPDAETGFRELDSAIDTVWFFPAHNLGMMIVRGWTEVRDSEAADLSALLLAYEHSSQPPREADWYRQVLRLRTNPDSALANAFNESQLLPLKSEQELQARAALKAAWRLERKLQLARQRKGLLAELSDKFGIDPSLLDEARKAGKKAGKKAGEIAAGKPDRALPSALKELERLADPDLALSPAEIASGDFDLSELFSTIGVLGSQVKSIRKEIESEARKAIGQAKQARSALLKRISANSGKASPAALDRKLQQLKQQASARLKLRVRGLSPRSGGETTLSRLQKRIRSEAGKLRDPGTGVLSAEAAAALQDRVRDMETASQRVARLHSPEPACVLPDDETEREALAAHLREEVLALLDAGADLSGLDLAGADLGGLDLRGVDLSETMLEKSDLSQARLNGARLQGAVLTGARVDGCDFSDADLSRANLSGLEGEGACFDRCRLEAVTAIGLKLPNSAWREASLLNATLLQSELPAADFSGALLEQMTLVKSGFENAVFGNARITRLNCADCRFGGSDFRAGTLRHLSLLDSDFERCDFSKASLQQSVALGSSRFTDCRFGGVVADRTGWRKLDLSDSDLSAAAFRQSDFAESSLKSCKLEQACFYASLFSGADCRELDANDADFYRSILRKADFSGSRLNRANLAAADLYRTRFADCELDDIRIDAPLKEEQYA